MKRKLSNNSGMSIVATVMIMLILALFAAAAVSLITTSAGTGIQEERGVEAFYIADGGMQYTLKKNTYPDYDTSASNKDLGDGSFTVTVPTLTSNAAVGDTSLSISSTSGFTAAPDGSYWTLICETGTPPPRTTVRMSSDCEKIRCNSDFSVCTRGKDSTDAAAHPGSSTASSASVVMMYSWKTASPASTTLARDFAKGSKCNNAPSRICLADTAGFASSGFIRINNGNENYIEDVFYDGISSGSTDCGSTCTGGTTGCLGFTSCTRSAFDGGGNGTVTHSSGVAVNQSEFSVIVTSEGKTPGAILGPLSSIKRVLQTNVLSLKDP